MSSLCISHHIWQCASSSSKWTVLDPQNCDAWEDCPRIPFVVLTHDRILSISNDWDNAYYIAGSSAILLQSK